MNPNWTLRLLPGFLFSLRSIHGRQQTILHILFRYFSSAFISLFQNDATIFWALVFGGILAGTFAGANLKIRARFRLSRAVAASITCFIIFVIVIVPMIYIFYQLSRETITLYGVIKSALNEDEVRNFLFGDSAFATFCKNNFCKVKYFYFS